MSRASDLGLDMTVSGTHGNFTAVLRDQSGEVVWQKSGYKSKDSAYGRAIYWLDHNYEAKAVVTPVDDEEPATSLSEQYARELRVAADELEQRAAAHYQAAEADATEAKRLRAMADAGPA